MQRPDHRDIAVVFDARQKWDEGFDSPRHSRDDSRGGTVNVGVAQPELLEDEHPYRVVGGHVLNLDARRRPCHDCAVTRHATGLSGCDETVMTRTTTRSTIRRRDRHAA